MVREEATGPQEGPAGVVTYSEWDKTSHSSLLLSDREGLEFRSQKAGRWTGIAKAVTQTKNFRYRNIADSRITFTAIEWGMRNRCRR